MAAPLSDDSNHVTFPIASYECDDAGPWSHSTPDDLDTCPAVLASRSHNDSIKEEGI